MTLNLQCHAASGDTMSVERFADAIVLNVHVSNQWDDPSITLSRASAMALRDELNRFIWAGDRAADDVVMFGQRSRKPLTQPVDRYRLLATKNAWRS